MGTAQALCYLGASYRSEGDFSQAAELSGKGLALLRDVAHDGGIARALLFLGQVARDCRDYERALSYIEESLSICRQSEDTSGAAESLLCLGDILRIRGDFDRAGDLLGEGLALYRENGQKSGVAATLLLFGQLQINRQDYALAQRLLREGLVLSQEMGNLRQCIAFLERLVVVFHRRAKTREYACLVGAIDALRSAFAFTRSEKDILDYDKDTKAIRDRLGEAAFTGLKEIGQKMSLKEAVMYALNNDV